MEDRHAIIPALQVAGGAEGATVAFASVLDGHMGSQVPSHALHHIFGTWESAAGGACPMSEHECALVDARVSTDSHHESKRGSAKHLAHCRECMRSAVSWFVRLPSSHPQLVCRRQRQRRSSCPRCCRAMLRWEQLQPMVRGSPSFLLSLLSALHVTVTRQHWVLR